MTIAEFYARVAPEMAPPDPKERRRPAPAPQAPTPPAAPPAPAPPADPGGDEKTPCDYCGGRGVYRGGGYVENGVHKGGVEGRCYRCNGKGYQTPADRRRNWGYDNYYRRV